MQDRLLAVFGLALVAGGFWLCDHYESDTALFPRVCLGSIGVLLVLLGIESSLTAKRLKAAGKSGETSLPMNWGPFFLVTLTLVAYGAALVTLGFYSASIALLLGVGFLWKGVKKSTIVIFTACFIVFLYVCFTILFNVPLPKGIFV
jgi:uncharacterized membrane protein YhaH (DUF805 family)